MKVCRTEIFRLSQWLLFLVLLTSLDYCRGDGVQNFKAPDATSSKNLNVTKAVDDKNTPQHDANSTTVDQKDVEHAALSAVKEEAENSEIVTENSKGTKQISSNSSDSANDKINITDTTIAPTNVDVDSKNETDKQPEEDFLPEEGAAEKEHSSSLAIFFVLFVIIFCIFLVHTILKYNCHHIPESLAIVFLGAFVGLIMKLLPTEDIKKVESFSPTMFFLVLLPPIIFESGYNLHKGKNICKTRPKSTVQKMDVNLIFIISSRKLLYEYWYHPTICNPGNGNLGSCRWWGNLSSRSGKTCLPFEFCAELCFRISHFCC